MLSSAAKKLDPDSELLQKTGADAVVSVLKNQDVEYVFGMIGGAIMPVYDALYRDGGLKHIVAGHEQGAAHMAEGYARATGRPGVVMTTSGPGATNLVTGLADAMMDSIPLVAITGQVSSSLLGNDAFQEADMWGITMPITKHNYQVTDVNQLADVIAEAFSVAASGRPGPVLIDLPKDVGAAPCPKQKASSSRLPRGYSLAYQSDPRQVEKALELLRRAKRPVILAGGGIITADACRELLSLAEFMDAPVASTLMGLGNFPSGHALSLGMPGMHGTGYANLALHNADALLAVGCRLDDRVTGKVEAFAPKASLIHLDVDASEIGKILPCAVGMVADAKPGLRALLNGARQWDTPPNHQAWRRLIAAWKKEYPMAYPENGRAIVPQRVVETLGGILDEDDVVVTGVGQHQMFTAQYYPFQKPRTFITSGGLGTMGFGLPAAIGAKFGRPRQRVVCVDGDGSFLMTLQELATAVRYNIGTVSVILKNSYLGMVKQWQDMFFGKRRSETGLHPIPYHKVSQAFGGLGREVSDPEMLEDALRWAIQAAESQRLPVVLEVQMESDDMVLPMVPAGAANVDFIPCQSGC